MTTNKKYRFHMLSLAHLPVASRYESCAFTQKIHKLSRMLMSLGHETFVYGCEGSDVPCTKFFETHTLKDIRQSWGEGDNRFEIGYNWMARDGYKFDHHDPVSPAVVKMRDNAVRMINEHKKEDDFLLCPQGMYHKHVADKVGLALTCEPGIGYKGSVARFRAFESAYIQNFTYGQQKPNDYEDVHFLDRVIPNYFDPEQFPFQEKKDDYFLFIGRCIKRKGIMIAYETAKKLGKKLKVAGQSIHDLTDDTIEYVGYANAQLRAELMGGAMATFVPTTYLEPFGGVAIESMLCGTPVITTNGGVFPEYVINDVNGYRCDVFSEFVHAAESVGRLSPSVVRDTAERYLMDSVKWEYQKWFDELYEFVERVRAGDSEAWWKI